VINSEATSENLLEVSPARTSSSVVELHVSGRGPTPETPWETIALPGGSLLERMIMQLKREGARLIVIRAPRAAFAYRRHLGTGIHLGVPLTHLGSASRWAGPTGRRVNLDEVRLNGHSVRVSTWEELRALACNLVKAEPPRAAQLVDHSALVASDAVLEGMVVVQPGVRIAPGAVVRDSILLANAAVSAGESVTDQVVTAARTPALPGWGERLSAVLALAFASPWLVIAASLGRLRHGRAIVWRSTADSSGEPLWVPELTWGGRCLRLLPGLARVASGALQLVGPERPSLGERAGLIHPGLLCRPRTPAEDREVADQWLVRLIQAGAKRSVLGVLLLRAPRPTANSLGARDGCSRITLDPRLDAAACEAVSQALTASSGPTLLDLGSCRHADGGGLAALAGLLRQARQAGRRIALIDPPPQLQELLEKCGLTRQAPVYPSAAMATKGLNPSNRTTQ
jgi:anti-anti-sigma regulatory factor